jgi:tetratricopeptide (TPR) repeat protein
VAAIRIAGGVIVLVIYGAVLRPASPHEVVDPAVASAQRWQAASREAYDAGRYADALAPTLELTKALPNQHVYQQRLAVIYQHLGRAVDEAAAWERMVAVSPTPIDACPAMADAYVRAVGYTDQALNAFERCVGFDPGNTDMLFYLGRARERAGRAEAAGAAYREAAGVNAQDADSQLGLARLDLRAGRNAEALEVAAAVLAANPGHADALLIAGMGAQRLGRAAEARTYLQRALTVAERYADVHLALGILDFSEGHLADARRHFERAVELEPARRSEVAVWLDRTRDGQ